jgi:hypothetical protein
MEGQTFELARNEFTISLKTDLPYYLRLRIYFPQHLRNESSCIVRMQMETHYDADGVSPAIDKLMQKLPPYGIIEGSSSQPLVLSHYDHSEC